MSGHVSGVSARLHELHPSGRYLTHCRNHALNLVIVASCNNVPDVLNFMDTLKALTLFIKYLAKRKHILHEHLKSSPQEDFLADCAEGDLEPAKRRFKGIPVLSVTRWLARVDSIDCLLKNYRAVCEAVEAVRNSSAGQSASDADSFLKQLLSFEFFVAAVICRHVLAYTSTLTIALQAKDCDLYKAHRMAQRLVKALESERAVDKFHGLWQTNAQISGDLEIEPAKKRSVRIQRNRTNPSVEDIEGHFRVAYYYAFLDHTISHLKTRFPLELEGIATFFLPSNTSKLSEEISEKIKAEFDAFLPQPSDADSKASLLAACNFANENRLFYPNIYAILLLLLCLPVGSCSCERSFSALQRLKPGAITP